MDYEGRNRKVEEETASLFQVDELFLRRILTRKSPARQSTDMSDGFRSAGQVPFQWEMKPGMPRINPTTKPDESRSTAIPPIRSPPASRRSQGLMEAAAFYTTTTSTSSSAQKAVSASVSAAFWKKSLKRNQWKKKFQKPKNQINDVAGNQGNGDLGINYGRIAIADNYWSRSRSASSSSSSSSSRTSSRLHNLAKGLVKWVS